MKVTEIIKRTLLGKQLFQNKKINWFLKLLIVVLLCWALYVQIFAKENINEIWNSFKENVRLDNLWIVFLALFLMPVNWFLETKKWTLLVHHIEEVPFFLALKGVFAGVALSLFTPNRVGEFGGRILVVKPENNVKTVVATLVGSLSQLVVLLSMGSIGLIGFIYLHLQMDAIAFYGFIFLTFVMNLMLFMSYFNVDLAIPLVKKIPYLKNRVHHILVLNQYATKELFTVLGLSFARYLTYSMQYFLLIWFFGIDVTFIQSMLTISAIFLLQTSIPLPPIMGLLARGEIAWYVWGFYTANEIAILSSTFGLWLINVILPGLVGLVFIININILSSLGYNAEKKDSVDKTREPIH